MFNKAVSRIVQPIDCMFVSIYYQYCKPITRDGSILGIPMGSVGPMGIQWK